MFRNLTDIPDYQHAAEGILADLGAHEFKSEFDIRGLLILHPFMQFPGGEDNVVEQPTALGNFSLEAWLVQVPGTGLDDLLLVVSDAIENVNPSIHPYLGHLIVPQKVYYSRPV